MVTSPDASDATVDDLPRRTWRRWWRELPGYWRIGCWALVGMVALHVALVAYLSAVNLGEQQIAGEIAGYGGKAYWEYWGPRWIPQSIRQVTPLYHVWRVDLLGDKVPPYGFPQLGSLRSIRTLVIRKAPVSDAGIEPVQRIAGLRELFLEQTNVTDEGLRYLEGLRLLTRLQIHDAQVTDAGLDHLRRVPNLRYINLKGTRVTSAGKTEYLREYPQRKVDLSESLRL